MSELDHGLTMLLLTDAESRALRKLLESEAAIVRSSGAEESERYNALLIFNRGITRGTERMAADFKARADAKKARGK